MKCIKRTNCVLLHFETPRNLLKNKRHLGRIGCVLSRELYLEIVFSLQMGPCINRTEVQPPRLRFL